MSKSNYSTVQARLEAVTVFNEKFEHPVNVVHLWSTDKAAAYLANRVKFLMEEYHELQAAGTNAEALDALIDMEYFCLGTATGYGISISEEDLKPRVRVGYEELCADYLAEVSKLGIAALIKEEVRTVLINIQEIIRDLTHNIREEFYAGFALVHGANMDKLCYSTESVAATQALAAEQDIETYYKDLGGCFGVYRKDNDKVFKRAGWTAPDLTVLFPKPLLRPLVDRVLILPDVAESKTASGIIIPNQAQERPRRGTVIEVGPGRIGEPMSVQKGMSVLYGKYTGTEVTMEGKEYLIMRESDIFAIMED